MTACAFTSFLATTSAFADPVRFDLPVQTLGKSLQDVAHAGGLTLAVDSSLLAGKTAPALHGRYEPAESIQRLLTGSGLAAKTTGHTVTITSSSLVTPGDIALGPVTVHGANATGSSDPTATEGTGSYTSALASIGSKIPMSIKDTPQAVSVITYQRMKDQNLFDMNSAMAEMTGVTVIPSGGNTSQILSRGFTITNIQMDGGATFNGNDLTNTSVTGNQFDMAEYDHLELVRGSDGMFTGSGDPSGTINLVRKRPLSHRQLTFDAEGGSWDNFREQLDLTGPLAFHGKLRGRIVASNQDQHYFYDTAFNDHHTVYATLEADLTPTTLLTVGGSYSWYHQLPNNIGLPRWDNGAAVNFPISTCLCYPWATQDTETSESFLKVHQKIVPRWIADLNFTTTGLNENQRETLLENAGNKWWAYRGATDYTERQYMLDGSAHGSFDALGHEQQFTIGGNWQQSDDMRQYRNVTNPATNLPAFPIIPTSAEFPGSIVGNGYFGSNEYKIQQYAMYSMLRVQPVARLHLIGGFRFGAYHQDTFSKSVLQSPTQGSSFVTPYAGATVDITKWLNAYFSYTTIFQPQGNSLRGPLPGTPLPPVRGNTYETGLKGTAYNGKLNYSLSIFRTEQINVAESVGTTSNIGLNTCCYVPSGSIQSEGVDIEVSGQILPRWQIFAGYTYNYIENHDKAAPSSGHAYNFTFTPRHMFKLWTTYALPGKFQVVSIGGGLNAQSSVFTSGNVDTVVNSSGNWSCPCVATQFKQLAYVTARVRVAWQITPNWQAAVNLDNISNTRYWARIGAPYGNNFYGTPRSFMFSIHSTY
jgi:outer membrane receptor for ferric coprogen and ferric-rhodotorulic acid